MEGGRLHACECDDAVGMEQPVSEEDEGMAWVGEAQLDQLTHRLKRQLHVTRRTRALFLNSKLKAF